jgi:polyisoprenoid-binding protein YceI
MAPAFLRLLIIFLLLCSFSFVQDIEHRDGDKFMTFKLLFLFSAVPIFAFAQSASVGITLTPAGSFKIKCTEVHGFVEKSGTEYNAKNILVGLKNLTTGVDVRDTHTKKYLEVEKFPNAILVSAKGKNGKGEGILRVKGIDQKIEGTYKIADDMLIAEFPIKLSDFKINDIKYMGVGVDDDAQLTVSVPIKKSVPVKKSVSAATSKG